MSLFTGVQNQMKKSYTFLANKYDKHLLTQLLEPINIVDVTLEVKMDDGKMKTFQAYRSQHSNVRGPFKGWIRYHQNVSLDEVKSLSAWMSFKCATVWIPLGWGKWGIIVNPKELSSAELERLSRAYIKAIYKHIGPTKDVPAPDVNTNGQIMARMADEYAKQTGQRQPWVITGKPLSIGGSKGRDIATSLGWLYVLQRYLKSPLSGSKKASWLKKKNIIIQWAGNAGLNFWILAEKEGAKILAIADSHGAIYDPKWLDMKKIATLKAERKSVIDYVSKHAKIITPEEMFTLETDILVPAALENQITRDNAHDIQAKIILELANGPTTPEAQIILRERNIPIIPDILANAWWVTVSYFEQVQNNMNFYRSRKEVFKKLLKIMNKATDKVLKVARQHKVSLRGGAYILAMERIMEAMKVRGW